MTALRGLAALALLAALAPIWHATEPAPLRPLPTWVSGEVCTACPVVGVRSVRVAEPPVRLVGPEAPPYAQRPPGWLGPVPPAQWEPK